MGKRGKGRGGGGGGRGRGRGRGRGGGGGGGQRNFTDNRVSFDQMVKQNEKFERYYNTLGIVPQGSERDAFWSALRRELPNSFRFTGSKGHALNVRDKLITRFFPVISTIRHEGVPVELPKPIAWYPEGLAYSMTTPKNVVRKYGPFKEFQRFLVSETGVGNISRQEEVSMIPPLLLDVRSHHTVLDLCAAPGSKSAQLIELIHAGEEDRVNVAIEKTKSIDLASETNGSSDTGHDFGRSTGMLVANDVNYQRAQMLVHQVKRLNSPNLIVMNHDATMFPSIELPAQHESGEQKRGKYLKFDRILADVPCSGDGTCRKNPMIWNDWTPQNGLGLYVTQVRILVRALQMLKVGGRVVYSTCSLNPVENEAVISSAIERCGGNAKVKLVECSDNLTALIRKPGLTDWSIMNRNGQIYESWAEAEQFEGESSKIVPGMFAPGPEEGIPLQNCIRVYPHLQNTGGFFIAALEKLSEIRALPESESKCSNRQWKFTAPSASAAFEGLLEEIATGQGDQPTVVPDLPSDASAAQRSNDAGFGLIDVNNKRSAPHEVDEPHTPKRLKPSEEIPDGAPVQSLNGENGLLANEQDKSKEESDPDQAALLDAAGKTPFEKTAPAIAAVAVEPMRRKKADASTNEESFNYLLSTHPELVSIYNFYGLRASFPRDRFLVRNPTGDPVKGIYYTSQLVKDILVTNEKRGMKFVHAGVKMFMKQDARGQDICHWRIQTEGLPIIEGWVGEERVVRLTKKSTLRKLLIEMFPKVSLDRSETGEEKGGWKDLGEIGEQVRDMGMGCCVLRVDASPSDADGGFADPLTLPLWRSFHSLNLMLPKEERQAMLLRIFDEDGPLINHSDPKQGKDRNGERNGKVSAAANGGGFGGKDTQDPQVKIVNDEDDAEDTGDDEDLAEGGVSVVDVAEESAELAHEALEADLLASRDRIESQRLEVLEDDNRKIAEAMPEREGEGDEANTTV